MLNITIKKIFLLLSILLATSLACSLQMTATIPTDIPDSPTSVSTIGVTTQISATVVTIPTTLIPTQIPGTQTQIPTQVPVTVSPPSGDVEVAVDPLRIILSQKIASGAHGNQLPRTDRQNVAPWDITPGHTQLKLEGYILQGKSHEPQIYVYPAQAYAEMRPAAFESLHRLNNILYDPNAPINNGQFPTVPFFNAAQVFASNFQVISFQNGRGVRFLTEYAQYAASVNNNDLFYHFQRVTNDGAYYLIAILPISAPVLAETSDANAVLPFGGIPYTYFADPNSDMQSYYADITTLLNTTSPEAFTPSIDQLGLLIQSIQITR
jgi:hypothetical protein